MSTTGTNEFTILNLDDLETKYRLLRIVGLQKESQDDPKKDRGQNDYYQNCQILINRLSFKLRQPVTIIERENEDNETEAYLVVPERALVPSSQMIAGGKPVIFEPSSEILTLNYKERSAENDKICLRFLEFLIQTPLHSHPDLWQPKAGAPYFRRTSENPLERIAHYLGFRVRPVITSEGTIALPILLINTLAVILYRPILHARNLTG